MKRGLLSIILIFLLLLILPLANTVELTGEVITGQATQPTNISITVSNIAPLITIYSPIATRTYRNESILLNYSVSDPDGISVVWYSVDDITNVTIGSDATGTIYFNASGETSHTLYFYVNDTNEAINGTTVGFNVNNTKIIVVYETFRGATKGTSTDFDSLTEDELQNISDMILENTNYGKILWNENINITEDANPVDRVTTLDNNVIIINKSIYVNETELPNLDKSATLWFYNLTFSNPRVLRDGSVCPANICTNKLYSDGTYRVDITGFANYSVEETAAEQPQPPGGGGGRARPIIIIPDLIVTPPLIKVKMQPGETYKRSLKIKNNLNKRLEITINPNKLAQFITFPNDLTTYSFSLGPREQKTIQLTFNISIEQEPSVYFDYIDIKTDTGFNVSVRATIEIEKEPLFDVKVKIPEKFLEVRPGEEINAIINISYIGNMSEVDAQINYIIKMRASQEIRV